MDAINDFFDFSKPFKREIVACGYVDGRTIKPEDTAPTKREKPTTEYVKEFRDREHANLTRAFEQHEQQPSCASSTSGHQRSHAPRHRPLDDVDISDCEETASTHSSKAFKVDPTSVYDRYHFTYIEPNLPIVAARSEILRTIDRHPVTVLQGSTGCGKSTQLPQFILDQAAQRREHCNIVVTQPRRIAARSIASRVCAERKWECGSVVGYQVGLNTIASEDTRLLFCTTGVLLEKLVRSRTLATYTHIVLDEVHERDQDMDFLFIVVRRLLQSSPQCKIVLMSATIEAPQFAEYFRIGERRAPVVCLEPQRPFLVREFYLCDLAQLNISVDVSIEKPGIEPGMYEIVRRLVLITERIDTQDQKDLERSARSRPTILIFLPGILEIETLHKMLNGDSEANRYQLFPLHSSITFEEQQNVFRPVPFGIRKIILSTNIAESSVTIPDVKYVFDFCLTKELHTDTATNFSSLELCWASRNNCIQRSGRAGRCQDGRVYRLVPRVFFDHLMSQSGVPEIVRSPLDRVVLKAKMLEMGAPHEILAAAMDPPNLSDIQNTVLQLKEMGALFRQVNGEFVEHDGDLSYVGRVMAALPCDVRVTRLILFGYCFSVLEECVIMAAGLNVKSIFNNPFNQALSAYSKKLRWSDGSGSDLFAILKAYRSWISQHSQNIFHDDQSERLWANRFFLQVRSLKEMAVLINELTERLDRLGIKQRGGPRAVHWTLAEKSIVLKCVIAGAFYPNYFMRMPFHQENDRDAHKELCGRDPSSTVFFRGFHHKYIGPLYVRSIRAMFGEIVQQQKRVQVSFDPNTEKIFVQFRPMPVEPGEELVESMPGQVAVEVYKAVKMRMVNGGKMPLRVMHEKEAIDQAKLQGLGCTRAGQWVPNKSLYKNVDMIAVPLLATAQVQGIVCNINDPHSFHFQSTTEQTFIRTIFEEINSPSSGLRPFDASHQLRIGTAVVCLVSGERHRGRITHTTHTKGDSLYLVRLIDFGVEHECKLVDLLRYEGAQCAHYADVPPRVFECRLAELQPSQLTAERGVWTEEAIKAFTAHMMEGSPQVSLSVFSVVNRIAHVIAIANGVNVNEYLVTEGLAQVCDESYASKADHIRRVDRQRMDPAEDAHLIDEQLLAEMAEDPSDDEHADACAEHPGPSNTQLCQRVQLSGPHSPLEAKVYGACESARHRTVRIEPHSVNSVMLEDRSQDVHNNVMVAATVTKSTGANGGNELMVRETTQMPNIPGFAALMALIFCPVAELRADESRSRLVSVLCGLGWKATAKRPWYEEHDVRFELDVDLNGDDLAWINQIRFTMDTLMYTKAGQEMPDMPDSQKHHYFLKIKERIIQLLERQRERIAASSASAAEHRWALATDQPDSGPANMYGDRSIFPFHARPELSAADSADHQLLLQRQRDNCTELHWLARVDLPMREPLRCLVCQILLGSAPEVKMHLYSRLHVDRERYIGWERE